MIASHKYAVGETVMFSPPTLKLVKSTKETSGRRQYYEIVQLLPALGDDLQYRIKARTESCERMVLEAELEAVPQPTALALA